MALWIVDLPYQSRWISSAYMITLLNALAEIWPLIIWTFTRVIFFTNLSHISKQNSYGSESSDTVSSHISAPKLAMSGNIGLLLLLFWLPIHVSFYAILNLGRVSIDAKWHKRFSPHLLPWSSNWHIFALMQIIGFYV
jgi:hypothetical protein